MNKYGQTPKNYRALALGSVEESRSSSMYQVQMLSRQKLPSLKASSINANTIFHESKVARSDKPLSPPTDSAQLVGEDGLLPEQIIAINNPDFIIHTYDVGPQRADKGKSNVFKSKRNTSHIIGDKSQHR